MRLVSHILAASLFMGGIVFAAVSPVGKINGTPVFKDDLERIPESQDSSLSAFDRLVLFRLAVEKAKKEKIEQLPSVKHDLDLVIYRHFLEERLKAEAQKLAPTEAEIKVYYEQHPLLRLRHIVLRFSSPKEQTEAQQKAAKIDALLRGGTPFTQIAEEYSQDETAPLGGDIGERGLHNLHEDFYLRLTDLQPAQVSARIESRSGLHYFQLVSKVPYQMALGQYVSFLTKRLSQDREHRFLSSVLNDLKKTAQIEVLQSKNE
ncbi:MAG: peptidylprolyl isomerase [Deltaproteobacteria bacterium]|nr:peptidylprolyl isomerase [Deltaproteobacteria bacterium]MBI3293717.1 peptidylprolyl isomerase [Deltaproteobacteria bacterium]